MQSSEPHELEGRACNVDKEVAECDEFLLNDDDDDDNDDDIKMDQRVHHSCIEGSNTSEAASDHELLDRGERIHINDWESTKRIRIAAAFLKDYEAHRPATLYHVVDQITDRQLLVHSLRSSRTWFVILILASLILGSNSWMHGIIKDLAIYRSWKLFASFVPTILFSLDIAAKYYTRASRSQQESNSAAPRDDPTAIVPRKPSIIWQLILVLLLFILCVKSIDNAFSKHELVPWEDVLTPIVWYYMFQTARDAMEANIMIMMEMIHLVVIKLFLVLIFSIVASQLFGEQDQKDFGNLGNSFISMFQLCTVINNPSLWIAFYDKDTTVWFFFMTFNFFFLLVNMMQLSLVFDAFIRAIRFIRVRFLHDRKDCLYLACNTLTYFDPYSRGDGATSLIPIPVLTCLLHILRPAYDESKIQALLEIMCNRSDEYISHGSLIELLPNALSISIHRHQSNLFKAFYYRLFKLTLGVVNLAYVLMATIPYENTSILGDAFLPLGGFITLTCSAELAMRCILFRLSPNCPKYKVNLCYDCIAAVAAITSSVGLILCLVEQPDLSVKGTAVNLLVIGRGIDLFRLMKSIPRYRKIVKRTKGMFSVVVGPIIVLMTYMHIFVYIGMALWHGKVIVGSSIEGVPQYYDLNNFNSYASGAFTISNILMVNDWNTISNVFIGISPRWLVMCYFISANLILVCVLLNVVYAFFVGAFLSVESKPEKSGVSESMQAPSVRPYRGAYELKKSRRASYDTLIHHVAGVDEGIHS